MVAQRTRAKKEVLLKRIVVLEALLQDRDSALAAIGRGDVDAVIVTERPDDYHLFTLQNIDDPYQTFVEQIQEGAVTLSENGSMLYGNPRLASILGISEEQVIGRKLQLFLPSEDAIAFDRMLDDAKHVCTRGELTVCSANGKKIPINLSLNFLRRDGESTLFCGVMTDVSEQKRHLEKMIETNEDLKRLMEDVERARDAAEQANRAKSRFLAGMSHELRTPLNGILGYAQLLRMEGGLNGRQATRVEAMLSAGGHLMEMIHCVLDLSDIETERAELHTADVDLPQVMGACLDLVRPGAEAKAIGLALAIGWDVPRHVRTDPTRLRQVLLNLLGNAVKFTLKGSVELRARTMGEGVNLRFEVTDTGPGISVEQHHRLFQEFERLDADATRTSEGTGLGLFLSAQLATRMGGRVGHTDNPAGGSVFWLELPLVAGSVAAATPASGVLDIKATRALRVLVVDDVAMNRDIAGSFLRAAGHEVMCVEGGADAIVAVATADFDVVLMDVRMPEMDGLEATRRIRALEGGRGRVPVVALTAQAFTEQIAECYRAGMVYHLGKPFTQRALLDIVTQATGFHDGEAAVARMAPEPANDGSVPASKVPSVTNTAFPIFNPGTFESTANFLTEDALTSYLKALAVAFDALLVKLHAPGALARNTSELAEAAHAIAGSAGMFGFDRASAAARAFQRAAESAPREAETLGDQLILVLEASLEVLDRRPGAKPVGIHTPLAICHGRQTPSASLAKGR